MGNLGLLTILVLVATVLISYKGFKDHNYLEQYHFNVHKILVGKDYKRLLTSGFMHVNWLHLIFNMLTLVFFSLELTVGLGRFALIYFGSMLGGSLLALYFHRNHPMYTAVGASGAVSGVVFASIALMPGMRVGLLFIPIPIPSWIFGLFYVIYTIYGIRSNRDNIGHEAHLGGGLVGMFIALLMAPQRLFDNTLPILCVLVPALVFLYLVLYKPQSQLGGISLSKKTKKFQTIDDQYHEGRKSREAELNLLLDKVQRRGLDRLSDKERARLDELSGRT